MKQKKTILARIFAGLFLLAFLTLTGLLIHGALQPEVLPLGAPMPKMAFQTKSGTEILQPDRARRTLVMYFHTKCQYCRAQLRTFDKNIAALKDTRMILLTHENDFFVKKTDARLAETGAGKKHHLGYCRQRRPARTLCPAHDPDDVYF